MRIMFEDDHNFTALHLIRDAREVGFKRENWKKDKIGGKTNRFITDSRGLLT